MVRVKEISECNGHENSFIIPSLKRPKPFFPSFRAFTRSLCFWLLSPHFLLRQLATEGGREREKRSLGETVTKNAKQRSARKYILAFEPLQPLIITEKLLQVVAKLLGAI